MQIRQGEVFGLLGPNGAGKSTTIRMLCTLLEPSGGRAEVNGYDVVNDATRVRQSLGTVLAGARNIYWKLAALLFGFQPTGGLLLRTTTLLPVG